MALSRLKTWAKEQLSFQTLNAEFNNIINNARDLVSPLTGTLDMDANALILDGDADTSISASSDDTIVFTIGGAPIYTLTASIFDFNGKRLDLDADNDTSIRAASDDTITIEIGGTDTISISTTAIDIGGLDLVLDDDADSKFSTATDDELVLTLGGLDAFFFNGNIASAVNGFTFATSATGNAVTINAHGTDGDIDVGAVPKGTGTFAVTNSITVDGGFLTGAVFNGSVVRNIASLNDGQSEDFTITVTGAAVGDFVMVSTGATDMVNGWIIAGHVTAANTVTVTALNQTGITSNPASATFFARVLART